MSHYRQEDNILYDPAWFTSCTKNSRILGPSFPPESTDRSMGWSPPDSPCPCPGPCQFNTLRADRALNDGTLPLNLFHDSSRVRNDVRLERSGTWPAMTANCRYDQVLSNTARDQVPRYRCMWKRSGGDARSEQSASK